MKRILFLLFLFPSSIFAQKVFSLEIKSVQSSEILSKIPYKKTFLSKVQRNKEIQNIFFSLYDNAYIAASADSLVNDSLKETVWITAGEQYKWVALRKGNVDEGILSAVGYREKFFKGKPFYFKDVRKFQEKILTYCENNGYPFASVKLDSIVISNASLSASINLQKNNLIKIDSVVNRGNAKISSVYLQSYLSIKNGDLYNESLVKKAGTRVKELPFVKEKIPFRVLFPGQNAKVELFLEKKRASQFDGIIGLLPDNITGKILFTGDAHLKLNNSFNRGELIELNWQRLQVQTQDLKINFVYPFLLKTPFGIDASFHLYKQDSTYLEVNPNFGIQYLLSGGNYFKAFVNLKEMTLLSTAGLQSITTLPPYADINSRLYGISYKSEKLDYRLNPRRGYSFLASVAAGNKVIKKNPNLDAEVYNGLKLNSAQYTAELTLAFFIPIQKRSAIKLGNHSAFLQNDNIFQDELYRIGGLQTLRGFDEQSIYASAFSIFTIEYRYLLEENSYLYLFSDGAYYENQSISFTGDRYDTPYGFGTGISFETKAGIFSINYALGKQFNNPINLKAGKINFGLVNYF